MVIFDILLSILIEFESSTTGYQPDVIRLRMHGKMLEV